MLSRIEDASGGYRATRAGAGHHGQTQAGLQPSGPAAFGDGLPAPGARANWRGSTRLCDEVLAEGRSGAAASPSTPSSADAPLAPVRALRLRGGASCTVAYGEEAERDAMVARFQRDGMAESPLFLLCLKAGGTGLHLTAANHVVHVDRWWNPAVEDQATAGPSGSARRGRPGAEVRLRRYGRGADLRR